MIDCHPAERKQQDGRRRTAKAEWCRARSGPSRGGWHVGAGLGRRPPRAVCALMWCLQPLLYRVPMLFTFRALKLHMHALHIHAADLAQRSSPRPHRPSPHHSPPPCLPHHTLPNPLHPVSYTHSKSRRMWSWGSSPQWAQWKQSWGVGPKRQPPSLPGAQTSSRASSSYSWTRSSATHTRRARTR